LAAPETDKKTRRIIPMIAGPSGGRTGTLWHTGESKSGMWRKPLPWDDSRKWEGEREKDGGSNQGKARTL